MSREDIAALILAFLGEEGRCEEWDWQNFIDLNSNDLCVREAQSEISRIERAYPSHASGQWCSEGGLSELRSLAYRLREP